MKPVSDNSRMGTHVVIASVGELVEAFMPPPLPPDPPIRMARLWRLLEEANRSLGRLDGISAILPSTPLFLYMYVRKEALLSSQIEGTQSSLSDLLLFESEKVPGVPLDDVREVSGYIAAMEHGLARIDDGFPMSTRLIREIHAKLMQKTRRGATAQPGEFRRSQNWIGGSRPGNARYVPPPPEHIADLMSAVERFIHNDRTDMPILIKAGLLHVQFESIHPFLDGNGRVGRLLITLLLCAEGVLNKPLLYLSLHFKTRRSTYYQLLQQVRENGDWEAWLEFFLRGVIATSDQAYASAREILTLFDTDRSRIEALGRPAASALLIHQGLQKSPFITASDAARNLPMSAPTAAKSIRHLESLGILHEFTGKRRGRIYVYQDYLEILGQDTAPLDP